MLLQLVQQALHAWLSCPEVVVEAGVGRELADRALALFTPDSTVSSRAPVVVSCAVIAVRLAVSVSLRPSVRASAGLARVLSSRAVCARGSGSVLVSCAVGPLPASP